MRWLEGLHPDPAWALVKLFERARKANATSPRERPVAELAQLPGRRALILVRPDLIKDLRGISLIPLQDGRGVADLEIAILDRLDSSSSPEEREALATVRGLLKRWRHERIRFEIRSIIVAERGPSSVDQPQPLAELRSERAR
ncbi:MAG: hypothetical protein GEV06_28925 [Luteitalea sp.]|nr:hypothetical protein [Luteitalea sp.]